MAGDISSMIQTTSSHAQELEQTVRSPQNELDIISAVTCGICDAGYAPSPAHQGLLQAPPKVLEAAFMSICHFCFRCRRPACPACWDAVHGVCGACVQEAHLSFRVDAAPLNGVIFPPVRQTHTSQENSPPPLLVCIRPGRFQAGVSLSTDPLNAFPVAPMQAQLEEETEVTLASPQEGNHAVETPARTRPLKVVERIVTTILLILLLAIAAMIILAELSGTANTRIALLFHVDIRHEIGYLISLVRLIHF
jgi:hypothetical protein